MTPLDDPASFLPSGAGKTGERQSPITVEANAIRHRDQLYLIPHSDPENSGQGHSLIRLIESDTPLRWKTLRSMLDDDARLSGRFSVEPRGFGIDGALQAELLEIIDCGPAARPNSPQGTLVAQHEQAGALMTLCRQLWARWSP